MIRTVLLVVVLLVGCGHQEEQPPSSIDYTGPSGTSVAFDDKSNMPDATRIENSFVVVQDCMLSRGYISTKFPGPTFRITNHKPHGFDGYTEPSGLIVLDITIGYEAMLELAKHESIHYLLLRSGQAWRGHEHEAFRLCPHNIFDWVEINVAYSAAR